MGNTGFGGDFYRQAAEQMAGSGREQLVRAIAEFYRCPRTSCRNAIVEPGREPCPYCWLRASRAMQVINKHIETTYTEYGVSRQANTKDLEERVVETMPGNPTSRENHEANLQRVRTWQANMDLPVDAFLVSRIVTVGEWQPVPDKAGPVELGGAQ